MVHYTVMTPEERQQLAARVLEKNKGLVGLSANPDFQDWLELVPKAELSLIVEKIIGIKRIDGWEKVVCELVIEYQAINHAIVELTTIRLQAAETARKELEVK